MINAAINKTVAKIKAVIKPTHEYRFISLNLIREWSYTTQKSVNKNRELLYNFRNKLYNSNFSQSGFLHLEVFKRTQKPEHLQQPDNNHNHNHHIEDVFDLAIHRDVIVYKPENDSDNNQHD
jgi:hypothetical protein